MYQTSHLYLDMDHQLESKGTLKKTSAWRLEVTEQKNACSTGSFLMKNLK